MNIATEKPVEPPSATDRSNALPVPRTKSPWKRFGLIAAAIAVVGLAIASLNHGTSSTKPNAQPAVHAPVLTVTVEKPAMKTIERSLSVHGTVSAWDPIVVGATTSGLEVKQIFVDDGASVKRGSVLATLDSAQLNAQLKSERARLAASIANERKSVQPNRPEDINQLIASEAQAEATVADQEAAAFQATANLAEAKSNSKRYEQLLNDGAVSPQEAETRQTTLQVDEAAERGALKRVEASKSALRQAQEKLSMAKKGGRLEDIQIAQASVQEIEGNVNRLETQVAQTIVKAPVDGMITRRDVHLGDISTAGKSMFSMARDNRLELRAQVPDTDLSSLEKGQLVVIQSALGTNAAITGKLREISPLIDSDSRLATVRIDLPNSNALKVGMYEEGRINVGKHLALTVPSQAVISRDEKNVVFVLKNDQVEKRQVEIGNSNGNLIEIKSGLKPDETVVVSGAGFLKDGDYVAIAKH